MTTKKISFDWQKKLEEGYLINLAQDNKLWQFIKDFPYNMELPSRLLLKTDIYGNTILHHTALNGSLNSFTIIAKMFKLDLSSVITKTNNYNLTFLHYAAASGHLNQVAKMAKELCLDLSKVINKTNFSGNSCLIFAAYYDHLEQLVNMAKELRLNLKPSLNYDYIAYAHKNYSDKEIEAFEEEIRAIGKI